VTDETSTTEPSEETTRSRTRARTRTRSTDPANDAPAPRGGRRAAASAADAEVEVVAAAEVVAEGDDEEREGGLGARLIRRRRRRGGRGRGGRGTAADAEAPEAPDAPAGGDGGREERGGAARGGAGRGGAGKAAAATEPEAAAVASDEGEAGAGGDGADATPSRTRTRTRSRRPADGGDAGKADAADDADAADAAEAGDDADAGDAGGDEPSGGGGDGAARTRSRSRRGRGSGGRAGAGKEAGGEAKAAEDDGDAGESAGRSAKSRSKATAAKGKAGEAKGKAGEAKGKAGEAKGKAGEAKGKGKGETAKGDDAGDGGSSGRGSTRLQAKGRGRSSRSKGKGGGRRPLGGVSEETRRAITEGPPRKMLVNFGEERTQVAVLEERTLVEHYVTRKEDVSYVGNIYLGRVQNVLPGMEAAFVDIGKGRNGVLYAGEVLYDEADLETDLPRIEDHLKPGQTVLVQVTKDPMGSKGARLTQHLSIAGRYCVLAPGDGMLGISRKLTDEERDRLRKILKSIKPEGMGLIVRTAAEGATQEQLEADVSRLIRIWEQVQTKSKEVKPLDAVYEEPHLVLRVIRDVFGSEFSDLVVDSEEMADQVRDYLRDVSPEMVDKVEVHTGEENIFDAYEVTTQVRRALEKKVWLKSGGYLIIEKTEAMWVIDVNTGKFVGKDNLEETVLKNNLEAADEIARQLRLRDMGGIIVIDFVDMLVPANRDEVLKRFKRELARDKTKSRVMDISKLGLVQMTRKNVSQGLTETFTAPCDACESRGRKILDHAFH
jgi:Rne/Rng family ribonuclease